MDDLGYINARIRYSKASLLKRDDFEELLMSKNLTEFIEGLKGTPYESFLPQTFLEPSLEDVLRAIREEVAERFLRISRFTTGEPGYLLKIIFSKFLVSDIKAIIRGKMRGVSEEEIWDAVFPLGLLNEPRIRSLIQAENPSQVVELLITWRLELPVFLGSKFLKIIRQEDIPEMEFYLDEGYYRWASRNLEKGNGNRNLVRYILGVWSDLRNIMGSLLLLRHGLSPRGHIKYLPFGHLEPRHLRFLANTGTLKEGIEIVKNTLYRKVFERLEEATPDLTSLERRFEESLTQWALEGFLKDPLSLSLPIAYIFSKYNEVVNLRILVYGIYHGVPPKEIRKDLIL